LVLLQHNIAHILYLNLLKINVIFNYIHAILNFSHPCGQAAVMYEFAKIENRVRCIMNGGIMKKYIILLYSLCLSGNIWAFPCFVTFVKDTCWTNYNVTITVINAMTAKELVTITVPEGESWARGNFNCQPGEPLAASAVFSPIFWQQDEGKKYVMQQQITLPEQISHGDTAWNINICYPAEFAEVPLPPDATSTCQCKTKDIPPVKPQ